MSQNIQGTPIKCAGGKSKMLPILQEVLPRGKRLVEPFVGGASVFMGLDYPAHLIADADHHLINFYKILADCGRYFVSACKSLFVPGNNNRKEFESLRDEFNETLIPWDAAIRFLYLNRHCFNGLRRYNSTGGFNVSFGKYDSPYFPEAEMIAFWQKASLPTTEIRVGDFTDIFALVRDGDTVYADPPYTPISVTANFTGYTADGFDHTQHEHLVALALEAVDRGVKVVISNHDTEITRQLYKDAAKIVEVTASRPINSKADSRGEVKELLACYW